MLATLLLSNAIVAWHSGAHYFEYQTNTAFAQAQLQTQLSTSSASKATQVHTELCDIGVLAQGLATTVAAGLILPALLAPSFWQRLEKPTPVLTRLFSAHHARAPPVFSR